MMLIVSGALAPFCWKSERLPKDFCFTPTVLILWPTGNIDETLPNEVASHRIKSNSFAWHTPLSYCPFLSTIIKYLHFQERTLFLSLGHVFAHTGPSWGNWMPHPWKAFPEHRVLWLTAHLPLCYSPSGNYFTLKRQHEHWRYIYLP